MYRILKFNWDTRHKHFFSSDWHTFHDPKWEVPIWESRGALNAQDFSEGLLEKINTTVGETAVIRETTAIRETMVIRETLVCLKEKIYILF
jgi:hypothetical protein